MTEANPRNIALVLHVTLNLMGQRREPPQVPTPRPFPYYLFLLSVRDKLENSYWQNAKIGLSTVSLGCNSFFLTAVVPNYYYLKST